MQTNHGPPQLLCISKLEKPSICSQHWCQSWKRFLQAPWKKKNQKWFMQPPVWKSWWSCGALLVSSLPLQSLQQQWLLEKGFCWHTNGCIPGLWKRTGIHLPLLQNITLSSTLWWIASLETPKDNGVSEGNTMLDTSLRCVTAFLLVSAPPSWQPNYALNTGY